MIPVLDRHVYISVKLQVTIKSRDLTFFLTKHWGTIFHLTFFNYVCITVGLGIAWIKRTKLFKYLKIRKTFWLQSIEACYHSKCILNPFNTMRSIVNWMMFKVDWNQTFFVILSGVPKKRPGTFFLVYHILETWKEICQTLRRLKLPTSSEILFAWQLPLVYTSTISRWVLLTIELACCYWMVGQRNLPCNDVLVLVIQSHTCLLSECKPRQQLQMSQKLLPGRKTFF